MVQWGSMENICRGICMEPIEHMLLWPTNVRLLAYKGAACTTHLLRDCSPVKVQALLEEEACRDSRGLSTHA